MQHHILISKKDLDNLTEQLDKMVRDTDRIRLVNAAGDSFYFSCDQLKQLIEVQHYGKAQVATGINLYPKLVDPENFEKLVLPCYKFDEDRVAVRKGTGR